MRKPKRCMIKIKHDLVKTYDYKSQKEHETNSLDKMWNKLNNNALAAFQCCFFGVSIQGVVYIKKKVTLTQNNWNYHGVVCLWCGIIKEKNWAIHCNTVQKWSKISVFKTGCYWVFILILCRFKLQFAKEKLTERLTKIRAMIVGCRARNVEL